MKKVLGIIPSRLFSSRIEKKPLKKILGIPLIIHVCKRANMSKLLNDFIVATDSKLIFKEVKKNGYKAILTSEKHSNGTERMGEVIKKMDKYDYYTLINGDEILLNPKSLDISIELMLKNKKIDASILAVPYSKLNSPTDFKLILNQNDEVLYISRGDIPCDARNPVEYRLKAYHLMTFKPETIKDYCKMDKTKYELIEDHEHLRLVESGYKIKCKVVNDVCISLDCEEDLDIIIPLLKKDNFFKKYSKKV